MMKVKSLVVVGDGGGVVAFAVVAFFMPSISTRPRVE